MIKLKPGAVPICNAYPFDTPYHWHAPYERELKAAMEGDLIEPCGMEESKWCLRAFTVFKSNGKNARILTDLKNFNKNITRPTHPTESKQQILCHICKWFCLP